MMIDVSVPSMSLAWQTPLLHRVPAQHIESRAQRFRFLRQGRQAPRTSLQNSSPPQSSSSVQKPGCCSMSVGDLCPMPPEGEVRGLGLTVSVPLLPEAAGRFLIALEFMRTVPA